MDELSLYVLDITMNSVRAGATLISVSLIEQGQWLDFRVQDNGCGMDETTMKRLFEPFFTTKPVGQGTGMGMAMAYGTIHSHHGSIGVTSKLNVGTDIYILLPKL
jgi:signal transduction histidine kinase